MVLKRGNRLGRYEIKAPIGVGGMGEVFRATDTKLRRDVAVKVLPDDLARDSERLARFEREARVLASLNHPNIGSIHGLEEFDGQSCLVLELVEGQTLAERIAAGALALEETVEIGRQVASAMEAAHAKGIVHRDLKPSNVMVAPDGTVKVLDFGLAKSIKAGSPSSQAPTETMPTRQGVVVGTAPYMSPEQASGKPVDKRTDIWSFGCLLYECLTGRAAFLGETVTDTLARLLRAEPDWSRLPAGIPASLRRVLRRCLEKDPKRRIHDIADARIELEDDPQPIVEQAGEPGGRRWWVLLAWTLVGLAAGVIGAVLLVSPKTVPERGPLRPAAQFTVRAPADTTLVPLAHDPVLAVSPDGRHFVYASAAGAEVPRGLMGQSFDRQTTLILHPSDGDEPRPIEGTSGALSPFFSPDGQWIGYVKDGKLKKQQLSGGAPITLCEVGWRFKGASWGEDNRIYFSHFEGIWVVSAAGGEPKELTSPDSEAGEKTHRFPNVLPRAAGVLFTAGSAAIAAYSDADIALLSLETGEQRILLHGGTNPRYSPTGHIVYARGNSLLAVRFNLETLQVTGTPFPVLDGVITSDGWGTAHFSFSDQGMLAYLPGGPEFYHSGLYWLDRNGGIEALAVRSDTYRNASFSPDGRHLAIDVWGANASIWTYDVARGTLERRTDRWDSWAPIWTPDGRSLSFASNWEGTVGIWETRSDGSGRPKKLFESDEITSPLFWSPDGTLFYVANSATGSHGIWTWSAGESPREFLDSPYHELELQLSSDGRWAAYSSAESGRREIYVAPASLVTRKRVSVDGGLDVRWSPDGSELFYWHGTRLMAVPISVGDGIVPGKPQELLETDFTEIRSYDIAPDGKRFIVVGHMDRPVEGFRVVVDWFDEIRRAAARSGS